jgi:hypothetical protein
LDARVCSSFRKGTTKHHEGARRLDILEHRDLRKAITGSAIEVHRIAAPELLESVHGGCLSEELEQAESPFFDSSADQYPVRVAATV